MNAPDNFFIKCDTVTASSCYCPNVSASDLSASSLIEIALVLGGEGVCKILNETLECRAGSLFIFDRNVPHGYFYESKKSPLRILTVSFDPIELINESGGDKYLLERLFKNRLLYSCSLLNSSAMSDVCRISGAIRRELTERSADWSIVTKANLTLLLVTIARYFDLDDTKDIDRPKEWHTVFEAINEITRDYANSALTEGVVADRLYVSRSHLSRAFIKVTGESFPDYLKSVRLREACKLLETTSMNNNEIAIACGIRDLQSFYIAFRKRYGVTPLRYRSMSKNSLIYEGENRIMVTVKEICENVEKGRAKAVKSLTEQAIAEGADALTILNDGLITGMKTVGEKFKNNQIFVPEVLMAARAMNTSIDLLRPLLSDGGFSVKGRVCIGTVRGDLHDIGKNLVKIMLESRGLEVIDLGVDVSPEKFIETAIEQDCQIICLSALLTTTMPVMGEVVKAAEAAGIRQKVKIMIGGAPVNEIFCQEIGADAYSPDAATAADMAVSFCEKI